MTNASVINNKTQPLAFAFMVLMALLTFAATAFAGTSHSWSKQEIGVKGTWSIEQRTDGNYLVLSDDFKTKNAPDLKFFVSNAKYEDVTGSNATDGAVKVAELAKSKGGQSYKIPSNIDISDYKTLILHCEQYSKLWASTPLK